MSFFSSFFKNDEEINKDNKEEKENFKNEDKQENSIKENVVLENNNNIPTKIDNNNNNDNSNTTKNENIENKNEIKVDSNNNLDLKLSDSAFMPTVSTIPTASLPAETNTASSIDKAELSKEETSKRQSIPDIHSPNSMMKSTGVLPMSLAPNTPAHFNDSAKVIVPPLNIAAAAAITTEEMKSVANDLTSNVLVANSSTNVQVSNAVSAENPSNLTVPTKAISSRSEFNATEIFNVKINDKLPLDEQLKQVFLQIETLDKCFQNVEISQELYTSHFARLNEKKIEIQDQQAKKYAEKRAREEAERELEELKNNPEYAPYYERFVLFDSDKSGSIELKELCELVLQCGYFFSDNLMGAIMKIYFPESPVLDFKDFIRLMQFVLGDLDTQLREHLKPAIDASEFQNFESEQAMQELLMLINYDEQVSNYDFSAAEARLAELVAYDRALTTSKQGPVEETVEFKPSNEIDKFGFDSNDEEYLSSCFIVILIFYINFIN